MTNEEKLDSAMKLILEVRDELMPDYIVEDEYYDQIETIAGRIILDVRVMHSFVENLNHWGSPKWNPDLF
jgi:hypothetical protein